MHAKLFILFLLFFVLHYTSVNAAEKEFSIISPDQQTQVKVFAGADLKYAVWHRGIELIQPSRISMTLQNGKILGQEPKIQKIDRRSVREEIIPVVKQKFATTMRK